MIRKKFKLIVYISILTCFSLMFMATTDPPPPSGGNQKETIEVRLASGYLGLCEQIHENSIRNLKINLFVDKYSNGQVESNFTSLLFNVNNQSFFDNQSNYIFEDVEVPSTGTYSISVTISGQQCFTCCLGPDCNFDAGIPVFQGVTAVINANSAPQVVIINPFLSNCN